MADWSRFRQTFADGLPLAEPLRRFQTVGGWLDLNQVDALAALQTEIAKAPGSQPLLLYQALNVLRLKLQDEAGIAAGPAAPAKLQALFSDVEGNRATPEQIRFAQRMITSWQLSSHLLGIDPELAKPVSPAQLAKAELQRSASAAFARLAAISPYCVAGKVTAETITEAQAIVAQYRSLAADAAPDNGGLADVLYGLGHATLSLALSCALLGRYAEARTHYEEAAASFEKAGEPAKSADCRARSQELAQRVSADWDIAAQGQLQGLAAADPFERAKSLAGLIDVASNSGDVFEATQNAEGTAAILTANGYCDPLTAAEFDITVQAWIDTAAAGATGIPFLRRLSQVGTWYLSVLNARQAALLATGKPGADRVESSLRELQKALTRFQNEASAAHTQQNREWAAYFPGQGDPVESVDEANTASDYDALLDRMRAIDSALLALREECNRRSGTGESKEDLLAKAAELTASAASLNSPLYQAKALLESVYTLLSLGRAQEMLPLVEEARSLLLAGRPATLSSFSQSYERYYYLETLSRQSIAQIILRDFEGALKTCQETIRDFETERYRINSPYRQSAVLNAVVEFYKTAVFAAFKLQRWDDMLEAAELIKARSAIRSRLSPAVPEASQSELAREFERLSDEMERNPAGDNADILVRRRQLWDLLSIERARSANSGEMGVFRLETLRAALAEDEALIGYFWLSDSVLLTMAVDRERFQADRISFKPEERSLLDQFVSFVQTLHTASRAMDAPVRRLGEILLPQFCRDFISGKKRIIFSPHRSLHLFPFHAISWEGEFLGTRFGVRYVPNFSSLLLPWSNRSDAGVLAIAISQFANPQVSPLPGVEEDVAAIGEFYRSSEIPFHALTGTEATRARVEGLRAQGSLSGYRCIHLGTHGLSVFDTPDQPMESKLLLQDAALDSMDIANLRLEADVAVLCACHSGQRAISGRDLGEIPGDDIFGLQAALFQSGVRSVLGTLWLVETMSSSAITRGFHRHFAGGESPEIALSLSVRDYLAAPDSKRGIFYWAPFFLSSLGSMSATNEIGGRVNAGTHAAL